MPDEIISLLALCVSVPVAVGYYKKVMGGNSKHDRFVEKAKRNGCVTTGVCVDTEYLLGDRAAKSMEERSPAIEVKYQYQVDDVTYHKRLQFQNPGSRWIDYPDTITIYYDKNNPKRVVTPAEFSSYARKQSGCLGAVGIWFALMMIVIGVLKLLFQG